MATSTTIHTPGKYGYGNKQYQWQAPDVSKFIHKTFNGYKRNDGRVGTANYWLFIPMVFCENRNLDVIKEALWNELGYAGSNRYKHFTKQLFQAYQAGEDINTIDFNPGHANGSERFFKNVDGIKFLNHTGGCGGTRQDAATLSALLAAYADHPNVGGITVMSLGCQHLQVHHFMEDLKKRNPLFDKPMLVFEQQQVQTEEQLITMALRETFNGLVEINKNKREPAPLSALNIGVKCGDSEDFNGISANPAIGYTSDLLVALGGKVLLADVPELCQAELNLIDRCVSEEVANKFIHLVQSCDQWVNKSGSGFHTSPVAAVLDYAEPATEAGLSFVCIPGNDVEATTGTAASGATLILFTTALETATGNPVAPTIKIATNSGLAQKMNDIIDIDTGPIVTGEKTIEQMGEEILEYCIKVASGEIIPKAVQLAQDDFIPWKRGVSL